MIDAHVHLITADMLEDASRRFQGHVPPARRETIMNNAKHLVNPKFRQYLADTTLEQFARRWLEEMDRNGLEKAVFFPISERPEQLKEFVDHHPDRFIGYAFLNDPTADDAPERLRRQVTEYGFTGLKLYPSIQLFHAYDKALFPLYEEAQSLGIPITFHMGITHAPAADYRYTNPLDLQFPLKLFPDLRFIVAHFGAGFFRELCLISYHAGNLFVDTSGTNNWRDYVPEHPPLEFIFKRALEIFGSERILFGTDTVMRPEAGYRAAIKEEQAELAKKLCGTPDDFHNVMGGNARALFSR